MCYVNARAEKQCITMAAIEEHTNLENDKKMSYAEIELNREDGSEDSMHVEQGPTTEGDGGATVEEGGEV